MSDAEIFIEFNGLIQNVKFNQNSTSKDLKDRIKQRIDAKENQNIKLTKNGQQVEINSRIQENDQEHPYLLELDDTLSNPENEILKVLEKDMALVYHIQRFLRNLKELTNASSKSN